MSLSEEDQELRSFFLDETSRLLADSRRVLLALSRGGEVEGSVEDVRRTFHNIKGAALSMPGCDSVGHFAGLGEKVAGGLARGLLAMNPGVLGLLKEATEALIVHLFRNGQAPELPPMPERLTRRLAYCRSRVLTLESESNPAIPVSIDEDLRKL